MHNKHNAYRKSSFSMHDSILKLNFISNWFEMHRQELISYEASTQETWLTVDFKTGDKQRNNAITSRMRWYLNCFTKTAMRCVLKRYLKTPWRSPQMFFPQKSQRSQYVLKYFTSNYAKNKLSELCFPCEIYASTLTVCSQLAHLYCSLQLILRQTT